MTESFVNQINYLTTVFCNNCGFVFRQKSPTMKWFEKLWKTQKKVDVYHGKGSPSESLLEERRYKRYANLENEIKGFVKNKTVLDVGTGTGTGLKAFKNKQWKCKGVEPVSVRAKVGKELGIDITVQGIEEFLENNIEKYDLVMLIQTLEHIKNPKKFLEKISKIVKDDGFLYVEVPDLRNYVNWRDALYYAHMNNFAIDTMTLLLHEIKMTPIMRLKPKTQPFGVNHLGLLAKNTHNVEKPINKINIEKTKVMVKKAYVDGLPKNIKNKIKFPVCYYVNNMFDFASIKKFPHQNLDGTFSLIEKDNFELLITAFRDFGVRKTFSKILSTYCPKFLKDKDFETTKTESIQ